MNPRGEGPDRPLPHEFVKESIRTAVRTADLLIVGKLHTRPAKRLKDELNLTSERYLAVTEASVYEPAGKRLLYQTKFMLVSNTHIVTVTPLDGLTAPPDAAWAQ